MKLANLRQGHHLFLNREGRLGSTDDFATSFLHFSLFSTALWDLPNSRPVHSLVLSSHLFCLPYLLPPLTVPCKMVFARPDERETRPYHCSLRLLTMVRNDKDSQTLKFVQMWICESCFNKLMKNKLVLGSVIPILSCHIFPASQCEFLWEVGKIRGRLFLI